MVVLCNSFSYQQYLDALLMFLIKKDAVSRTFLDIAIHDAELLQEHLGSVSSITAFHRLLMERSPKAWERLKNDVWKRKNNETKRLLSLAFSANNIASSCVRNFNQ